MRKILFFTILLLSLLLHAESPAPVQAKEPIRFATPAEDQLSAIGAGENFVGTLYRENIKNSSAIVELYEMKDFHQMKLSKKICSEILEKVMGPMQGSSFQILQSELRPSRSTGQICLTVLKDKDAKSTVKERHIFTNILNLKTRAYVFKHQKSANSKTVQEEELQFIESLRPAAPAPGS